MKIKAIKSIGKADVFNLHVEDTHSFLANGIVAHNCYDETRYALMSRPAPVRQIVTIAPKAFDPFSPPKRRFA